MAKSKSPKKEKSKAKISKGKAPAGRAKEKPIKKAKGNGEKALKKDKGAKKKPVLKKVVKKVAAKPVAKPQKKVAPTPVPVKKVAVPPKEMPKASKPEVAADPKAAKKKPDVPQKVKPSKAAPDEAALIEGEPEPEDIVLTDAEGRRYCRVRDCDQIANVDAYCRYHYLLHWKKIQIRKKILSEGKLERYIEELTARYPDKYLEMIRKDLRSEKEFLGAIQELEIDESVVDAEFEDESEGFIDEVRGMSTEAGTAREDEEY